MTTIDTNGFIIAVGSWRGSSFIAFVAEPGMECSIRDMVQQYNPGKLWINAVVEADAGKFSKLRSKWDKAGYRMRGGEHWFSREAVQELHRMEVAQDSEAPRSKVKASKPRAMAPTKKKTPSRRKK